jgi:hypothetical protein
MRTDVRFRSSARARTTITTEKSRVWAYQNFIE